MRAAVLEEYGEPLSIREVEPPSPEPHGAVVEVDACGICRSDWHAWQGHGEWADDQVSRGQVLGHEPAGTVTAVGDRVDAVAPGDRIAVPFNLGDGTCRYCQNGRGNVCEHGLALGFDLDAPGAFAEYLHVPNADYNAAPLPAGVSTTAAAALGCRYATAYHALAHQADLAPGDHVAVFGCGGVGLSAIQVADALGASVVAVDIRAAALERADAVGAAETVDASADDDAAAAVKALTGGGVHVSIDALGSAATCRAGVESLRRRGTHVQVGLTGEDEQGEIPLPTDELAMHERSFVGARGMPPSRYDELFRMIESDALDPGALVGREVSLSAVPERLAAMTDYQTEGIEVVTEF